MGADGDRPGSGEGSVMSRFRANPTPHPHPRTAQHPTSGRHRAQTNQPTARIINTHLTTSAYKLPVKGRQENGIEIQPTATVHPLARPASACLSDVKPLQTLAAHGLCQKSARRLRPSPAAPWPRADPPTAKARGRTP
eukprot:7188600-Prymnesium_polylepis.1